MQTLFSGEMGIGTGVLRGDDGEERSVVFVDVPVDSGELATILLSPEGVDGAVYGLLQAAREAWPERFGFDA